MRLDECARSMMDVLHAHAVLVLNLVRMTSIRTFGTSRTMRKGTRIPRISRMYIIS